MFSMMEIIFVCVIRPIGECVRCPRWRAVHVRGRPRSGQKHLQRLGPQCDDEEDGQPSSCKFGFVSGNVPVFHSVTHSFFCPCFLTRGCRPDCESADENEAGVPLPHSGDEEEHGEDVRMRKKHSRWGQKGDGWIKGRKDLNGFMIQHYRVCIHII